MGAARAYQRRIKFLQRPCECNLNCNSLWIHHDLTWFAEYRPDWPLSSMSAPAPFPSPSAPAPAPVPATAPKTGAVFWPQGWWNLMELRVGVLPLPVYVLLLAV